MPSRILRESIVSSESVASMTPGAQDRLHRYFLLADDFGCFLVQPAVIRGRVWPLRPDVTDQIVTSDLAEFEKAEIIQTYSGPGNKRYAWFPKWLESQRAPRPNAKRKCPIPPGAAQCPPKPAEAGQFSPQSQSSFDLSQAQAQDPPIPPASGGPSVPGLRVVKDPETPLVEPVRLQKRKRPGRTLAEDVENERQTLRDNRSRLLWRWLKERPRETWDEEAQAFVEAAPPTQEAQLEWVQQHCRASPEEAADIVAIVAALISPPEVRNGSA